MDKFIKIKRKALNGKYYDYLFQITKYLQSENLTKYAYYKLRDKAIEDLYQAQQDGIPVDKIYKKGYEVHFKKKAEKLPKMGIIEQISNIWMVFFALFACLALFVYVYHLFVKVETYYSEGLYLYISVDNLRNMVVYGFLGAVVATFLQKIDKRRKWIQGGVITGFGIVCLVSLMAIASSMSDNLKLNMLIIIPLFIVLAIGGYFLNDFLAKKKYNQTSIIENE